MLDRREFLAFLGVGASLAEPAFSLNVSGLENADDTLWFFDESLLVGQHWSREIRHQGFRTVAMSGDAAIIYDHLAGASTARPSAIAGLTTGMVLFATTELALGHGYRLSCAEPVSERGAKLKSPSQGSAAVVLPSDPGYFDEPVLWRLEATGACFRT